MKTTNELHQQAMAIADEALIKKWGSDTAGSITLFEKAFHLEKKAALRQKDNFDEEPTRAILFRSAASLGLNCGDIRGAEIMVAHGLLGNPPLEIAEELRDIYENITFQRHLELRGVSLESNELQMSIAGDGVGFGMVKGNEFLNRLEVIEKLTFRTAERLLSKPFREKGGFPKNIKNDFEPYISVPRAASFAISIRIGRPTDQLNLNFGHSGSDVINEIVDGINLLNEEKDTELKEHIAHDAYFRNFVALTKELAPDGKKVKTVGLTYGNDKNIRKVALKKIKSKFKITDKNTGKPTHKIAILHGRLSWADADNSRIRLTTQDKKKYMVKVPPGLLRDVVKPHWDDDVIVHGTMQGTSFNLIDIEKA